MGAFGQAFNSEKYEAPSGGDIDPFLKWDLDEGSGTIAYDTSGNGYNGSLINSASFSNDYVIVGGGISPPRKVIGPAASSIAQPAHSAISIIGEVYVTGALENPGYIYIEETPTDSGRVGIRIEADTHQIRVFFRDSLTGDSGSSISVYGGNLAITTWYFVAARIDLGSGIVNLTVNFTQYDWSGSTGVWTSGLEGPTLGASRSETVFRKYMYVRNVRTFADYISDQQLADIRTSLGYT